MRPLRKDLPMYDPRDPFDRLLADSNLRAGGEIFEETMRDIRKQRAQAQAEEEARRNRRIIVRSLVRIGVIAAAAVVIVKAINKNEEPED
ncbi:membrane protein [Streptomyces phage Miek]|nr:hypothetical protein SEA_SENDITCS_29 [Streptomyces phage SendItCS]WIC89367.1 membrane protein [Streptomyces phage Miek]